MRSTGVRTKTGRKRPDWLAIGILCLTLGVGAIALGAPLSCLDQDGWPWTGTISQVGSGYEITITHPGGKTDSFRAATYDQAIAWMDRRNTELKHIYHLDTMVALGRALVTLGWGLTGVGVGVLIWRLVRVKGRRRPRNGGAASAT